jgi:hypothetical protein
VGEALRSLAAKAKDVFVGQVVGIARKGGVVEVRFRVDQEVVGARGGEFVLREWAGLWPAGMERYYVGQRAMVFAAPAGPAGLSTTVDGADGVVPVMVGTAGEEYLLDTERLEARVLRAHGEALGDAATGAMRLQEVAALVVAAPGVRWREPVRLPVPVRFRRLRGTLRRGVLERGSVIWEPEGLNAR